MNKAFKRFLSGIITASMVIGSIIIPQSALAAQTPVVDVTFDNGGSAYTLNGGTITENTCSNVLKLSGSNQYASINDASAINSIEGDFTFSVMCNPANDAQWTRVYDIGTGTGAYIFLAPSSSFGTGLPRFAIKSASGNEQALSSDTPLDVGEWNSVIITRSSGTTKMYVNGVETASTTGITYNPKDVGTTTNNWIGRSQFSADPYFAGMVDNFAVYDRALSAEEISGINGVAEERKAQQNIAENNCYIYDVHFYTGDENDTTKEIFSIDSEAASVTAEVTVKNYTDNDDEMFKLNIYSVNAAGEETLLDDTSSINVQHGRIGKHAVSFDVNSDAVKYVVKENAYVTAEEETKVGEIYVGVQSPVAAPIDSGTTTAGAHDPSIVKFPGDDTYYVYSSHHLIFTSTDLINWKKYDFTNINASSISPKTAAFISSNYENNPTMNGTYWAPDVIYKEGDSKPYWMYISLSCGLKGRNSAIALIKSPTPLFWADPDANKVAAIEDAGVVYATKENSNYKTNAIDANIYYDSSDNNKPYFVWGSFWGGIQAAPLTEDGRVSGIDYTSDSTILSSCQNFGTSIFTQKSGVAGPEGAWMIEHGGYRYAFTSYGWLGSNYNTRVARAPLTGKFSDNMGTQLLDANNTVMGTQYSSGSTSNVTGYKLIGSYRLGDGATSISTLSSSTAGYGYYYARSGDDAHVYYGPGHNSVINIGDETFYVSHTRKDMIEGAAYLQVRKLMFTEDGWPVVSPVTYTGEKEQRLPKDMLTGTYDLASVGRTKFYPGTTSINTRGSFIDRNYDLPVISSKVTLNADGTMADGLGTWDFDNDHTVTLTFAKDGDTSKDEFYKKGDVMKMYALFGYDKDEGESAVVLTGTDENHVTQFAKKSLTHTAKSLKTIEVTPVSVEKSTGGNPIAGSEGSAPTYLGDPSVLVDGDTVYLYAGHDNSTTEDYSIPEYLCYSSKDLKTWTPHGSVFAVNKTTVPWASGNTAAWASQVLKYNNKYYLFYCTWAGGTYNGYQCIGVATSSSPTGPFTNQSTTPLINGQTMTTENTSKWNDIDPTVWIETVDGEEHIYLNWGNSENYTCELSINGDTVAVKGDIVHSKFNNIDGVYTEAPYLYRRTDGNGNYTGKYYLFFAKDWREQWAYATTDDIMSGEWDYENLMMTATATSNTSHGAVFDFNGKTYFIYHNGAQPWGSGFRRTVNIQEVTFDEDGKIPLMTELSTGIAGSASYIKQDDNYLYHENFTNPLDDVSYPLVKTLSAGTEMQDMEDALWEIVPGKADKTNEYYVSIQAVNKPGLYIQANADKTVSLTQDATQDTDKSVKKKMTFRTVEAIDGGEGVSFESISMPGYFLTKTDDGVALTKGTDRARAVFNISKADLANPPALNATISDLVYEKETAAHFMLNNAKMYKNVDIHVGEYDKTSGNLIGVAGKSDVAVTSMAQAVDIEYVRKSDNSSLKVFVWKDMMPVTESSDITQTIDKYVIPEGFTSYYSFDDTLADSKGVSDGVTVGANIGTAKNSSAIFDNNGYKGKAVKFTGDGSDGINLGHIITSDTYTISFRMNAAAFTAFTSALFIDSGSKSNENWLSAPFATYSGGATGFWSNKGSQNHTTVNSSAVLNANEWNMITFSASGGTVKMYVNGTETASGEVKNTVSDTTNIYLAVNYWDTPFNGLIDELYAYNGTALSASQISSLYNATR